MHSLYCIHIWHLNLPCSFKSFETFSVTTKHALVWNQNKLSVSLTRSSPGNINGYLLKLDSLPIGLVFRLSHIDNLCNKFWYLGSEWYLGTLFLLWLKIKGMGEMVLCPLSFSSFHCLPSLGAGLEVMLNRFLINW